MFKRRLLNKKGSIAIDGILTLSVTMFIVMTILGWYTYLLPRQGLEKQVHLLAQKAKIQGGLTATSKLLNGQYENLTANDLATDLGLFLHTLEEMGHDISKVRVTCQTVTSNTSCLGVSKYGSTGTNYIKRDSLDIMIIRVEIPTKVTLLAMSKAFFGSDGSLPESYIFSESVMSERW